MALLVRTECRTFTAAYMVWSSVAKEMRPRKMAGPPMKSKLLAAGLQWNTLTPAGIVGTPVRTLRPACNRRPPAMYKKGQAACANGHLQPSMSCALGRVGYKGRGL